MTFGFMNDEQLQYERPVAVIFSVDARDVLCGSGTGKTEDFDDLEDFQW